MTPEQIAGGWAEGLKNLQAIHHQTGNYMVETDGSNAGVFCYGTAYHYLENPTGNNTRIFVGSYDFRLEKNEGKWTISAFKFSLKFIDGNKNLEG